MRMQAATAVPLAGRDRSTVDLGVGVGHVQGRFTQETHLRRRPQCHGYDVPVDALVAPDDIDVPDPEGRALRQPALQPDQRAIIQRHHSCHQDAFFAARGQQHVGETVIVDAVGLESIVREIVSAFSKEKTNG